MKTNFIIMFFIAVVKKVEWRACWATYYFKQRIVAVKEDIGDDTMNLECWKLKRPKKYTWWTTLWAAHTAHLTFATSFTGIIKDLMVKEVNIKITEFDCKLADVLKSSRIQEQNHTTSL